MVPRAPTAQRQVHASCWPRCALRAAALRSAGARRAAAQRSVAAALRTTGSREAPTRSAGRRWSTCNPGWTWTLKARRNGGTAAGCTRTRQGVQAAQACCGSGLGWLLTCTVPPLFLLKKPPPLERVAKLGRDAATFSAAGASEETSSAKGAHRDASACVGLGAESKSGPGPTASSCAGASNVDGE